MATEGFFFLFISNDFRIHEHTREYLFLFSFCFFNFIDVNSFIYSNSISPFFPFFSSFLSSLGESEGSLTWGAIQSLLLNEGENISENDLESYLAALLGAGMEKIPQQSSFDSNNFTESILGFES